MLIYIHGVFSKRPSNCLNYIQQSWPRDGILRVEIIPNVSANYSLIDSYRKEYGALNYHYLYGDGSEENVEEDHYYNNTFTDDNITNTHDSSDTTLNSTNSSLPVVNYSDSKEGTDVVSVKVWLHGAEFFTYSKVGLLCTDFI